MNDTPLISIITPTYNSEKYIKETIESIVAQSYSNWELLITDDCSTDSTIKIVKQYLGDSRIKLFSMGLNSGAGVARNNSIKEAKGRFIAFCDSDDVWLPDKLEKQIGFMIQNNYYLSFTSYWTRYEQSDISGKVECFSRISFWNLVKDNCIGCLTAIYDSSFFGKVYMPIIRKRQDWGLWLILIKKSKKAFGIKEPLAIYRIRGSSISSNKLSLVQHNINIYTQVLGYPVLKAWVTFLFLFLPVYIKKKLF